MVHGGFHGAWCWERVIAELERLGHEAVAVDLPGRGEGRHETAPTTFKGRTGAVLEVVQPGDILVGHSDGGFDITHAADAVPNMIAHVCYLAAGLPRERRTWPEAMAIRADGTMGDFDAADLLGHLRFQEDGAMSGATVEGAREKFFHDCDDETVQWAFERLCPERGDETSSTPVSVAALYAIDAGAGLAVGHRGQARPVFDWQGLLQPDQRLRGARGPASGGRVDRGHHHLGGTASVCHLPWNLHLERPFHVSR